MPSAKQGNAATGMDTRLMCELLGQAAVNDDGKLQLLGETAADPGVAALLRFLVDQRWLREDGPGAWIVTLAGRFWFQSLDYGDTVKFHKYGGAVFLLQVRLNRGETIVWHKGRFATINIEFIPQPEHFEIRRENESTTTSGGVGMREALAVACGLLAENLESPQPPQPPQREELRLHMLDYLERL